MADKIKELWPKYTFFPGDKIDKTRTADLLLEAFGEKAKDIAAQFKDQAFTDSAYYTYSVEDVISIYEKCVPK